MFRKKGLGRRHRLPSLVRKADAYSSTGARVHSIYPYGPLPRVPVWVATPSVILSSSSISDETPFRGFVAVMERTLGVAVAI